MGSRLKYDPRDPFFRDILEKPKGVSGGCYCCGKQIHIEYQNIDILPKARINTSRFHILVCDDCEEDLAYLENEGKDDITFDTLYCIQEDLNEKLVDLDLKNGGYSEEDRKRVLSKVVTNFQKKFKG